MPTWGELLGELQQIITQRIQLPPGVSPFDFVRRKYLVGLAAKTGRNVILYASKWTQPGGDPALVSITDEDIEGFMEVIHGLNGSSLDLIVHSPGGKAESTEALVTYLRSKFSDIRVLVPHAAMSAATMLACAANRVVMGKHSFLGPIDPQLIFRTDTGGISSAPAQAILKQFERAKSECQNPALLASWLPILRQYGPALIVQCEYAQELAKSLVADWLEKYMFSGESEAKGKAGRIAEKLASHADFKTHGRFLPREMLKDLGMKIDDLETDQVVQDLVLSIFHATGHTFGATPAVKIIENHLGKAFIKVQQTFSVQQFVQPQPLPGALRI